MTVQYVKLHYTNMLATPSTDEMPTSCTVDVVQHLVDMRHTDLKWRTKRMSNILILVCSCVMQSSALANTLSRSKRCVIPCGCVATSKNATDNGASYNCLMNDLGLHDTDKLHVRNYLRMELPLRTVTDKHQCATDRVTDHVVKTVVPIERNYRAQQGTFQKICHAWRGREIRWDATNCNRRGEGVLQHVMSLLWHFL